jgi:hypothetical protein
MKILKSIEMRSLNTILLNCRETFPANISNVFIKFVKSTYNFEDIIINQE